MWLTAVMLGLAGSLHCLGMCSPLAMAVTNFRSPFFTNRILYNVGRLLSYGILGMIVAAFGSLFQFSAYQNTLSIVLGASLVIMGIAGISSIHIPLISKALALGTGLIKNLFSTFLSKKTWSSMTLMGMLNGLLPCGLTYLALTYCITLPDISQGFLFMIVFGSGTLPVMLGLTTVLQSLIDRFHLNFRKLTTTMMIVLGLLLVSRGYFVNNHTQAHGTSEIVICR